MAHPGSKGQSFWWNTLRSKAGLWHSFLHFLLLLLTRDGVRDQGILIPRLLAQLVETVLSGGLVRWEVVGNCFSGLWVVGI